MTATGHDGAPHVHMRGRDDLDAPARRRGNGSGYPGQNQLAMASQTLRAALARLARDLDPAARREGARIATEATVALQKLSATADRASTAHKRQQEQIEGLDRAMAKLKGRAG